MALLCQGTVVLAAGFRPRPGGCGGAVRWRRGFRCRRAGRLAGLNFCLGPVVVPGMTGWRGPAGALAALTAVAGLTAGCSHGAGPAPRPALPAPGRPAGVAAAMAAYLDGLASSG